MDLVLREDVLHDFLIQVAQRLRTVQLNSSQLGGRYLNLGRIAVETNAYLL